MNATITPLSKRSSARFFNWEKYFQDMYVSAVRAVTGAVLSFGGSNAAENVAPVILDGVGMNWKQALIGLGTVLVFDLCRYVNLKPLPDLQPTEQPYYDE